MTVSNDICFNGISTILLQPFMFNKSEINVNINVILNAIKNVLLFGKL